MPEELRRRAAELVHLHLHRLSEHGVSRRLQLLAAEVVVRQVVEDVVRR